MGFPDSETMLILTFKNKFDKILTLQNSKLYMHSLLYEGLH